MTYRERRLAKAARLREWANKRQTAAAAPDLLEACKFAAEQMNHYGNTANWPTDMPMEYGEAINRLRSAIAKAKEA